MLNSSSRLHRALGLWGLTGTQILSPCSLMNNAFVLSSLTKCLSLTAQGYRFPHQLDSYGSLHQIQIVFQDLFYVSKLIASHIFLLYSFPHIFRPFFPHLKLIFIYLIFFLIFPQHNKTTCVIIEEPAFPHAMFISEKVNVPSIDRRKLIMEATKKTQNILLTFVLSTESQA